MLVSFQVLSKPLRGDTNVTLVSKIIIERLYMVLNEQIFPPSRYAPAEVFRSVYLCYMRGLCTEEDLQSASGYYSRM